MPFTLKETTADNGLCGQCEHAGIFRGDRLQDHEILCNWHHPSLRLRRLVRTCTLFEQKNALDKHEMEKIAWVIEVKAGKFIGFRPPKRSDGQ